jgi:thiamine-monophosphate kinase
MRGEFELIARYLAPLARGAEGALGLTDDAALLAPPQAETLVLTVDTLVEGVHYLPQDPADQVARKLLRVNLSDLAAMGARPLAYLLSLALPRGCEEAWLAGFTAGLAEDQAAYGLDLIGGDTVGTDGPATLTLTAVGAVAPDRVLRRATAAAGDGVYVSGSLGDAALGLKVLRGELKVSQAAAEALAARYRLPRPRVDLGRALAAAGLASAAIDVSDGLVADLGHLCEASHLGAEVEADAVPLSEAAAAALQHAPELRAAVLTGGDDYELLFTVPPQRAREVGELAERLDLPLTRIGRMTEDAGVRVLDAAGRPMALNTAGWTHF